MRFILLVFGAAAASWGLSGCAAPELASYACRPGDCYECVPPACASRIGVKWATVCGRPFTITYIRPESHAGEAGLRPGDQLVACNGIDMHDPAALGQLFRMPPGSRLLVTYFRCGVEHHTTVITIPQAPWER
ncbi:MAG TPA: PDZ domain-containing protein [Chthoniobacteraceae bacterium]|jgi:predicted metalloprotease with PDZ domain